MKLDDLTHNRGEWLRGSGPEADIVISSRIRLARNLADFPFISRAPEQDRARIEKILREAVLQTDGGRKLIEMMPRRRVGAPQDLDSALMMLCANESHFVNGAVIAADDGFGLA